jgi:hypothetical protein
MSKPNRPNLAELLAESARKAEQERADKQQVERITAAVRAQLAHKHKAEAGDDDLVCPSCGYKGSEEDFEPDDDESDGYSTDPVTSGTDNQDSDNGGDNPQLPNYDNRARMSGLTPDQVRANLNKIRC